jgi:hypothetical protein
MGLSQYYPDHEQQNEFRKSRSFQNISHPQLQAAYPRQKVHFVEVLSAEFWAYIHTRVVTHLH